MIGEVLLGAGEPVDEQERTAADAGFEDGHVRRPRTIDGDATFLHRPMVPDGTGRRGQDR